MAFFLCAKYSLGSHKIISIPNTILLSNLASLNPQKSLNIDSTLPNWASTWTSLSPNSLAKSLCHDASKVEDVMQRGRLLLVSTLSFVSLDSSSSSGGTSVTPLSVSYDQPLLFKSQKRSLLIWVWVCLLGSLVMTDTISG